MQADNQMDEHRFRELLDKHLAGGAAPDEVRELLRMIKDGEHDWVLKQQIDDALQDMPADRDLSPEAAHHILFKILSSEENTDRVMPGVRPMRRYRVWLPAAAAILVLAAAVWLFKGRPAHKGVLLTITAPDTTRSKYLHLPDGSTVLLRGNSELITNFTDRAREVVLLGEGYFDVHPGALPFIVHTGGVRTTVLGTAFNIRAWPGQQQVVVTVAHGRVRVSDASRVYGEIGSNEQIEVDAGKNAYTGRKVNADSAVAWKREYLVLDDLSLEEAVRLIEDRFHVHIVLANDDLKNERISATFLAHESMTQVLNVVCGVINATYTIEPDNQIIMK